jgi:hypothetical protein
MVRRDLQSVSLAQRDLEATTLRLKMYNRASSHVCQQLSILEPLQREVGQIRVSC